LEIIEFQYYKFSKDGSLIDLVSPVQRTDS
jgi:hypothetical protein